MSKSSRVSLPAPMPRTAERSTSAYARTEIPGASVIISTARPGHAPIKMLSKTRRPLNGNPGSATEPASPSALSPGDAIHTALACALFAVGSRDGLSSTIPPDYFDADIVRYRIDTRCPGTRGAMRAASHAVFSGHAPCAKCGLLHGLRAVTLDDRKIHAARIAERALNGAAERAIPLNGGYNSHPAVDARILDIIEHARALAVKLGVTIPDTLSL